MIAIKNADGTLVPVVEGLAGNQRTVALSLVHTNQKRAEIQLYEIEAPEPGAHPPLNPGQKPFGVLVLKKLPENPFGEVEITASISVDQDLRVHVQAEAEGIRPSSADFRLPGAVSDQAEDADAAEPPADAGIAPALGGMSFDLEDADAQEAPAALPADDPFDFSAFDLDSPESEAGADPLSLDDATPPERQGLAVPDAHEDFSFDLEQHEPAPSLAADEDGDLPSIEDELASLDFDTPSAPEVSSEDPLAQDDVADFSFELDEPEQGAGDGGTARVAEDDPMGLDDPFGLAGQPGLDDSPEIADASETDESQELAVTPSLASLDFDNFDFDDTPDQPDDPGMAAAADADDGADLAGEPAADDAVDLAGLDFDLDEPALDLGGDDGSDALGFDPEDAAGGPLDAPLPDMDPDADEVPFELDLSSDEEPGELSLTPPPANSLAFIDDPDDTDWGFDELADPADEDLASPSVEPAADPPPARGNRPAAPSGVPDFSTDGETLDLGDEGDFSSDFDDDFGAAGPADFAEATAKPEKPAKSAKPTKPAKPTRPAKSPRPGQAASPSRPPVRDSALTSRLLRGSIVLFGVSVIELGVYLALHFGWLP